MRYYWPPTQPEQLKSISHLATWPVSNSNFPLRPANTHTMMQAPLPIYSGG